jgi:hypothetical protein
MDASAVQIAGGAVIAQQIWHRMSDLLHGRHRVVRAQANFDRNRVFVQGLGLDPARVLGDRPTLRATAGSHAASDARRQPVGGFRQIAVATPRG